MKIRTFIVLSTLLLSLSLSAQIAQQSMRSTSPMLNEQPTQHATASGFRAISTTPTIGIDGQAILLGTATETANTTYSVKKSIPNPPDDDKPNPIGDSVLPLLLFSVGYAFLRLRKKSPTA